MLGGRNAGRFWQNVLKCGGVISVGAPLYLGKTSNSLKCLTSALTLRLMPVWNLSAPRVHCVIMRIARRLLQKW